MQAKLSNNYESIAAMYYSRCLQNLPSANEFADDKQ